MKGLAWRQVILNLIRLKKTFPAAYKEYSNYLKILAYTCRLDFNVHMKTTAAFEWCVVCELRGCNEHSRHNYFTTFYEVANIQHVTVNTLLRFINCEIDGCVSVDYIHFTVNQPGDFNDCNIYNPHCPIHVNNVRFRYLSYPKPFEQVTKCYF